MADRVVDWRRATLVGALVGGVFWGLAAGAILAWKASATAVVSICVTAAVMVIAGAFVYRRGGNPRNGAFGIGLILAPLTGVTPVLVVWLPGLLTHAISWRG
ncbi:hypothetical protein FHT44_000534 [Mycolicibacterium sp. BK634]|uniref:hypothetical protein n=1 Tax=Mycobacteriaceae TaxID=1762 RepID=UPI00105E09D1|nr:MULTISPECIES: hypothetical protein [Mycobacteriaceae]MBB3748073.1 hypothetical protein [Mycolicibacterium sp. BK634]TDO07795.1 hypothetical protein EV580_5363 [Mycobacterium sp. BK086]